MNDSKRSTEETFPPTSDMLSSSPVSINIDSVTIISSGRNVIIGNINHCNCLLIERGDVPDLIKALCLAYDIKRPI